MTSPVVLTLAFLFLTLPAFETIKINPEGPCLQAILKTTTQCPKILPFLAHLPRGTSYADVINCVNTPEISSCKTATAILKNALATSKALCNVDCSRSVETLFSTCLSSANFSPQQILYDAVRISECPDSHSRSNIVKRNAPSPPVGIGDLFDFTKPACSSAVFQYGPICLGIFSVVLADAEAVSSLNASLTGACAKDWRNCLSNVGKSGLDATFHIVSRSYGDLCGSGCWEKTFDLVDKCLDPKDAVRTSYLAQKSFIHDYISVMCLEGDKGRLCGQLELEFYFMRQAVMQNSSSVCDVSALQKGQCPQPCKDELEAAKLFLGCCLGSQLRASNNDTSDVTGYRPYFDQCGVSQITPCNKRHLNVRVRSEQCQKQLARLGDKEYTSVECALDFDQLVDIIVMAEDSLSQVICVDGINFGYCRTMLNEELRDLANVAGVLCKKPCFNAVDETFRICSADLNLTVAARLPFTFVCYQTDKKDTEESNCAVQYQEYIEEHEGKGFAQNNCSYELPVNGQCPKKCLTVLNNLVDEGLGCCLGSQASGNFSALDPVYFQNLALCLPLVKGGEPKPCQWSAVRTSVTPSTSTPYGEKAGGVNVGAIAGGVSGAILAALAVGLVIYLIYFRGKGKKSQDMTDYAQLTKHDGELD